MADSHPKLDRAIRDSLKAYADGNRRFFGYLRDDVRVFALDSATPIIGRKAFESGFGPTFVKTKRKVATVQRDLQITGDQAVLAQTLQITANRVSSYVRQTVIWNQEDGDWKISHIHNAQVGQPIVVGAAPRTAAAVRVVNERIATAAAVVGVAQ